MSFYRRGPEIMEELVKFCGSLGEITAYVVFLTILTLVAFFS